MRLTKYIATALAAALFCTGAALADQQVIDRGLGPRQPTQMTDSIYSAFGKINGNFSELYAVAVAAALVNVRGPGYGAKCDAKAATDGATTVSPPKISSASSTFTSADIGKQIGIAGAGPVGVSYITTISAIIDAHTVTPTAPPPSSAVANEPVAWGTDDQAAFTTALATGRPVYVPQGACLIGTGGLTVQDTALLGDPAGVPPTGPTNGYGSVGAALWRLQTANPTISLGHGGVLRDLQFLDPLQRGQDIDVSLYAASGTITGSPIAYAPTIQSVQGQSNGGMILDRLVIWNGYDCIKLGDGTNNVGIVEIRNLNAFCLHTGIARDHGIDVMLVDHPMMGYNIFGVATTHSNALAIWAQRNAILYQELNTQGASFRITSGLHHGARVGIDFVSGSFTNGNITGSHFEAMPTWLRFRGAAVSDLDVVGSKGYCQDSFYDHEVLNCVDIQNGGNGGRITFSAGSIDYAQGSGIVVASLNPATGLTIQGMSIRNFGRATGNTGTSYAIDYGAAGNSNLRVASDSFLSSYSAGRCVRTTAGNATISGNDFVSCVQSVEVAGTTNEIAFVGHNKSRSSTGTAGTVTVANTAGATYDDGTNSWDRPPTTPTGVPFVLDQRPSLSYTTATAQAFTTEAAVVWDTKVFDQAAEMNGATGVATASRTGTCKAAINLSHDGTTTTGDLFNIKLVVTAAGSSPFGRTQLHEERVVNAIGTVSWSPLPFQVAKGDTIQVDVVRASGTGTWTLPANGQQNSFSMECR